MKKLFFIFFMCLTACVPNYNKPAVLKDYSQVPLMELPVSRVSTVSEVNSMEREPHVEKLMPMSVERFLKSWGAVRLRPNYQSTNKAEYIIREASMTKEDAPEASFFTYDNYKYILKYALTVVIKNENNEVVRTADVDGFLSRKLPKKASIEQRDDMFTQMLVDLENTLDKQFPEVIKQNLLDQ